MSVWTFLRRIGSVWIAVIALYLLSGLASPAMLTLHQLLNVLQVAAFLGVVSLGETFALLVAGIDLSVAGVVTMTNILATAFMGGHGGSVALGVAVPLAVAAIVGMINGLLVAIVGITPLIATLGSNAVLYGGALLYTGGAPHGGTQPGFAALGQGSVGGLPASMLIWFAIALACTVLLRHTVYGRRLYAIGANARAARFTGIAVRPILVSAYVASSLLAAMGGLLLTAYIGQPALGIGDQFLFTSIAAVVVGGTALTGGVGGVGGTVGGALLITELNSITDILRVSTGVQYLVQGSIIALSVLLYRSIDRARRTRETM